MTRGAELAGSEQLTPAERRSNRWALAALIAITLAGAIAAGIGLVGRIVDDDLARPNRSGASTLDDGRAAESPSKGNDGGGAVVVIAVGAAAAACVAAPFVLARRRRQRI